MNVKNGVLQLNRVNHHKFLFFSSHFLYDRNLMATDDDDDYWLSAVVMLLTF